MSFINNHYRLLSHLHPCFFAGETISNSILFVIHSERHYNEIYFRTMFSLKLSVYHYNIIKTSLMHFSFMFVHNYYYFLLFPLYEERNQSVVLNFV